MKPFSALPLSLLSVGLALSAGSLRADDTVTPPPLTPPPTAPADATQPTPPPAPRHHHRPGYVLEDLTRQLNLTPDQQKQVAAILKSDHEQMKAVRGDDSIAQEDKRAKMKEIMGSTRTQIRALLTPDQQKAFDALPHGEHGEKPPAPTPVPTT
jgi:Spy/CpxP family protein refolding chaperone